MHNMAPRYALAEIQLLSVATELLKSDLVTSHRLSASLDKTTESGYVDG